MIAALASTWPEAAALTTTVALCPLDSPRKVTSAVMVAVGVPLRSPGWPRRARGNRSVAGHRDRWLAGLAVASATIAAAPASTAETSSRKVAARVA